MSYVNPKTSGKCPTSQNIFQLCVEQLRIWWDFLWQKINPIIFGRPFLFKMARYFSGHSSWIMEVPRFQVFPVFKKATIKELNLIWGGGLQSCELRHKKHLS